MSYRTTIRRRGRSRTQQDCIQSALARRLIHKVEISVIALPELYAQACRLSVVASPRPAMAPLMSSLPLPSSANSPSQAMGLHPSAMIQAVQRHLGSLLRRTYEERCQEPLPERFKALIEELEKVLSARGATAEASIK